MAESHGLDPRHDPIYQRGYDPTVHGSGASQPEGAPSRRSRNRSSTDESLFAPPGAPPRSDDPERRGAATGRTRAASRDASPATDSPATDSAPPLRVQPPDWPRVPDPTDGAAEPVSGSADDELVIESDGLSQRAQDAAAAARARSVAPWRNPYLLGLAIGGAVLALLGFQMFRAALETIYVDFAQAGGIFGGEVVEEEADKSSELVSMQIGWSLGPLLFILGIAAILSVLVFVAVRWRPASASPDDAPPEPDPS